MIYGTPRLVTDREEKLAGLRALAEHIVPGQWDYARRPNKKELAKTSLLALGLAETSVKIRTRPARRRRLARRGPAGLGRRAAAGRRLAGPGTRPGAPARDTPAPAHRRPGPPPAGMTAAPVQPPLSASGRYIVDAHGRRVRLAGVNWYGAHEDDGVVSGLDRTDRCALARAIARLGFNSVRLPFSLWMTEQATPVPAEYLAANPDLSGVFTPMQVYDACVEALTDAGLVVIPNCHTLDAWLVLRGGRRAMACGSTTAGRPRGSSPPGGTWPPGTGPTRWSPGWTS